MVNQRTSSRKKRVAEFFAGIGLVRLGLEQSGFEIVYANDIEPKKKQIYELNFSADEYVVQDIRGVKGRDIPDIELATASFPCTDFSLAGKQAGLAGVQSSMFWEFTRILEEMGPRKPQAILLENVPSFATSHQGADFYQAIKHLNDIGYWCEILQINASVFVPQSRARLFIIGSQAKHVSNEDWYIDTHRPAWIGKLAATSPELKLHVIKNLGPVGTATQLDDIVERLGEDDHRWWNLERTGKFVDSLSPVQVLRMDMLKNCSSSTWATAYRRTRNGRPVWEMRADNISGCLRTAKGGSSKQALVQGGNGAFRVRWMTGLEYARLQGVTDFNLTGIPENQILFAFGDAVCVPVITWIAEQHINPIFEAVYATAKESMYVEH